MKFALVNDERRSASPGLRGLCPGCGESMIAKCGHERVHHWAHHAVRTCDPWREPETAWHRRWKNRFPPEWQEVIRRDGSGEKHIADVRTAHGLTIEFQHSHLKPEEMSAREQFYGNMVWVVDGLRLVRDLPRFMENFRYLRRVGQGVYITPFPYDVLPRKWLDRRAPVIFDFWGSTDPADQGMNPAKSLWCLLPARACEHAVVVRMAREDFVRCARERPQLLPSRKLLGEAAQLLELEQARQMQAQRITMMRAVSHRPRRRNPGWWPPGSRRRF